VAFYVLLDPKMPSSDWETRLVEFLPVNSILAGVFLLVATLWICRWMNSPNAPDWTKELQSSKMDGSSNFNRNKKNSPSPPTGELKSIWEERKKNGTDGDQFTKTDSEGRPFGSSYYFAHHKSSSGGYKDGLRMEDYAMNGPRLLSKEGQAVDGVHQPTKGDFEPRTAMDPTKPKPFEERVMIALSIIPITRYLFDDPGDPKGIATIRIEGLPSKDGKQVIPWKDANVKDIKAELVNSNKGLSVQVETDDGKYRLHIPALYRKVDAVTKVSKGKRLVVRLYKSVSSDIEKDTAAWPYPYAKST
jgi:hypothetical protein